MYKPVKETILIVDDKPGNILALESLLNTTDRRILHALTGNEGLKLALDQEIDLILLDIQMPEMDGFEVAQILKTNKRTREIPIIFITAEIIDSKNILKGYEEGAVDYLTKPLDPQLVKAKVNVLLRLQAQKKELIEKNLILEKYNLLINNSADMIGVIDRKSLKFEQVNQAVEEILYYSEKELLKYDLFYLHDKNNHQHLKKLSQQEGELINFETWIFTKKREQKWLHWKIRIKGEKWFFNARDITEIKKNQRIRSYLATVVKQSNNAIYISDSDGNIISWNIGAEKIYGYSEREALKMKIWNIIPDIIKPEASLLMQKILKGERILDLETKRINKFGKLIDVLYSATLLDEEKKSTESSIAITERDITQQNIAEERIKKLNQDLQNNVAQLEFSNQELESFSYSVSHDLRAPLRALYGYAQIIEEDFGMELSNEAQKYLNNIKRNAQRMGVLIDDLLNLSRLGRKEVDKNRVDMLRIVNEVIDSVDIKIREKSNILVDQLPSALVDYTLFRQVWENLISNAIKYSSKKNQPAIHIYAEESTDEITYHIEDNGVGFKMDYADKLFGVFQRLHSDQEFEGTGVGLAIVKRIINKHHGKIWVDSQEGIGTTFSFTLPKN
ncbi:PAS domain S-box-containing protein [Belliella buryatensis]|uniref:histidine kinase n=1 Tax=Belliella buryatensis TaxID=1500549 RepID=A0A239GMC6_9BACT|nr:PAS domain S-box protein [Belliella buryatensis]SNS70121.1 PAS domain S-box-containing protein [Belliella buryatensis]